MNNTEKYKDYANKVLNGEIPACEYIKLACRRYLSFFDRDDMYFDEQAVEKVVNFISKFKHDTGKHSDKPFILEDWQLWIVSAIYGFKWKNTDTRVCRKAYIEVGRKNGKALAIDTPIPTPDGWKTMGDLKVGDKVYGADGRPCTVTFTTGIMTGHRCYRVEFEDGETVVADAEHNWKVKEDGHVKVLTTEDMLSDYSTVKNGQNKYRYRVPKAEPVTKAEQALPIDPYLLGVWLQGGDKYNPILNLLGRDLPEYMQYLPPTDKIVQRKDFEKGCKVSYCGHRGKNNSELRKKLEDLALLDNKHIPECYLNSHIGQRLALLQGMCDVSGRIYKAGNINICTRSRKLTEGLGELLGSLGIKYRVQHSSKENYVTSFYTDKQLPCFRLKRKYLALQHHLTEKMQWKSIVKIEEVDTVPVKCITVDSYDHLYLFGRRFTPTHNTSLVAALCLYHLIGDGEGHPEIVLSANSAKQAALCFNISKAFLRPYLKAKVFKTYRDRIEFDHVNGKMHVVSADASKLDGLNCSMYVTDELHAAPDSSVWDVLETSQGMREQPLAVAITTAGFNRSSFCYQTRETCVQILNGTLHEDSTFAAIYTLDKNDDPYDMDRDVWKKANPNLGVTVNEEYLESQLNGSRNNPLLKTSVVTKLFNVWLNSHDEWIAADYVLKSQQHWDLKLFPEGTWAYAGIDLAAVSDLACVSMMVPDGNGTYYFRNHYYVPEQQLIDSRNRDLYRIWGEKGFLTVTPGNVTDYDYILTDLMRLNSQMPIISIGYDPWNSTQFITSATQQGLICESFQQTITNYNRPTKEFARCMLGGYIVLYPNPIDSWCFQNVALKTDWNENQRPIKGGNEDGKIDGVVAMLTCFGNYLQKVNPWDYTLETVNQ